MVHGRLCAGSTISVQLEVVSLPDTSGVGFILQDLGRDDELVCADHGVEKDLAVAVWLAWSQCDGKNTVIPLVGYADGVEVTLEGVGTEIVVREGPHAVAGEAVDVELGVNKIGDVGECIAAVVGVHVHGDAGDASTDGENAAGEFEAVARAAAEVDIPD